MQLLTKDAAAAQIHVSFMGKLLTPDALTERIRDTKWTHVVAFRPTGKCMLCILGPNLGVNESLKLKIMRILIQHVLCMALSTSVKIFLRFTDEMQWCP